MSEALPGIPQSTGEGTKRMNANDEVCLTCRVSVAVCPCEHPVLFTVDMWPYSLLARPERPTEPILRVVRA